MKSIKHVWSSLAILGLLTACASQPSTTPASSSSATSSQATSTNANQTVTIQALDANKQVTDITVPLNPKRIAVLDMATLDTLDSLDLGDRIVGSAQVSIDYLKNYNPDDTKGAIANLGTVKTVDLEAVAAAEPDIIFIGGRLSASYADLEAIAPVVYLAVDYDKGVVQSTQENARTIAKIFGLEV